MLATICLSLGDNQFSLVRLSQNAHEAWNRLENHYQVKSLANKVFLRKRYFAMTMGESNGMMQHTSKMNALTEQLHLLGASVTADDQVMTLLCSLPDSYDNLLVALEFRAETFTMEFVTARLLQRRKESEMKILM